MAHEYTPQEALDTLLSRVRAKDEALASEVQAAIDAGKDVRQTDPTPEGRKKPRIYRKILPLSPEEALQRALDVLQSHFLEQPLFADSTLDDFEKVPIAIPTQERLSLQIDTAETRPLLLTQLPTELRVEIETQKETQITPALVETYRLQKIPRELIEQQRQNILRLRDFTNFTEP